MLFPDSLALLRGGGDLASGVAARLHRSGFPVAVVELAQPLMVRRAVSFAEAVYAGQVTVEDIVGRLAPGPDQARQELAQGNVPVLIDPEGACLRALAPQVVVDARIAKANLGTRLDDAPLVIGLGPGFTAGVDCHAVVETMRGHTLGRVYWQGTAAPNTGVPEGVAGKSSDRVLRAPSAGHLAAHRRIGDRVQSGELIAEVVADDSGPRAPITAPFAGVVRGLIHPAAPVSAGMKVGDLDPRGDPAYCFTVSDKALAVGGGVLEAILAWQSRRAA